MESICKPVITKFILFAPINQRIVQDSIIKVNKREWMKQTIRQYFCTVRSNEVILLKACSYRFDIGNDANSTGTFEFEINQFSAKSLSRVVLKIWCRSFITSK